MPQRRRAQSARKAAPAPGLFDDTQIEQASSMPDEELPAAVAAAPGESRESALTITTLVRTAKDVLEGAFFPLWVHGEISDYKRHRNGHWYFCLRDESSQIRCVVWSRDQLRIPAAPADGVQVAVYGRLTVYAARGDMQFTVSRIEAVGDGLWRKALEQSIKRLTAEGLLAPERKRRLPTVPRRIAIVTSPDGAALRDIIAVVRRRCPNVELVVCGARVQGDGAPEELVAAIERVGRWGEADVVIVGRGGGAREDLWAFNDERVARALAACPIPTISAVGHEVDVTLCDLVADLRAPTPSAAAESAVPVLADLKNQLIAAREAMRGALARRAVLGRRDLERRAQRLANAANLMGERRRSRLERAAGRLNALSPLAVLGRGYAVARDSDGTTLADAERFRQGMNFVLQLRDGRVSATANEVIPGPPLRATLAGDEEDR